MGAGILSGWHTPPLTPLSQVLIPLFTNPARHFSSAALANALGQCFLLHGSRFNDVQNTSVAALRQVTALVFDRCALRPFFSKQKQGAWGLANTGHSAQDFRTHGPNWRRFCYVSLPRTLHRICVHGPIFDGWSHWMSAPAASCHPGWSGDFMDGGSAPG